MEELANLSPVLLIVTIVVAHALQSGQLLKY